MSAKLNLEVANLLANKYNYFCLMNENKKDINLLKGDNVLVSIITQSKGRVQFRTPDTGVLVLSSDNFEKGLTALFEEYWFLEPKKEEATEQDEVKETVQEETPTPEIVKAPEENKAADLQQIENLNIIAKLSEFESKLLELQNENKLLKEQKNKKFDFEEFKKRAEKINELEKKFDVFESKFIEINAISFDNESENFEHRVFKLSLHMLNSPAPIFSISNVFILNKFKEFILSEISIKLDELTNDIENLKNI